MCVCVCECISAVIDARWLRLILFICQMAAERLNQLSSVFCFLFHFPSSLPLRQLSFTPLPLPLLHLFPAFPWYLIFSHCQHRKLQIIAKKKEIGLTWNCLNYTVNPSRLPTFVTSPVSFNVINQPSGCLLTWFCSKSKWSSSG